VLVVLDRVVALCCQDEVRGDELGALVKQLVERVLGVSCRLTEDNWPCGVLDVVSATGDCLSVGLHGQLLQVSGEPVEVLVEADHCQKSPLDVVMQDLRRDKVGLGTEEV
jgi:hypothetical protein